MRSPESETPQSDTGAGLSGRCFLSQHVGGGGRGPAAAEASAAAAATFFSLRCGLGGVGRAAERAR